MKLYIVSGLGADFSVFEKLEFPKNIEICFLPWLIPHGDESLSSYVERMSRDIKENECFALLGYSFGGIIAQEIHKMKPAQKVIILASIKSHEEKSCLMKWNRYLKMQKWFPEKIFQFLILGFIKRIFRTNISKLEKYFTQRDIYYLKWSVGQICDWKGKKQENIIQICGDKDKIFPINRMSPNIIIKGGNHLFPLIKHKKVSVLLNEIFKD